MNKKAVSIVLMIFEVLAVISFIAITITFAKKAGESETAVKNVIASDISLMVNTLLSVPGDAVVQYPLIEGATKYVILLQQDHVSVWLQTENQDKQSILYPMDKGQQIAIYNEFDVNKNSSTYIGENILIFLKAIYDKKSDKEYDWVFATNVEWILLEKIITTYKKRWRIETQFRVQDEARIKCKSKEMKVRYFFFMFEQMLQTIWICFYKDEISFKEFLIEMSKVSKKYTNVQQ